MKLLLKLTPIMFLVFSLGSCSVASIFQSKPANNSESETPKQEEEAPSAEARFSLKVGSPIIFVNDIAVEFNVAVQEIEGRTMIPLTFFKDYCQMKDLYYDPTNETITFSMPVDPQSIPSEDTQLSLKSPGTTGAWYDITFKDPFTGDTTLSMMIDNVISGNEAVQIVTEKDPLALQPKENEEYSV